MKLVKIFLEDFRGYYGLHEVDISDFTAFIGKNDAGKSSIFEALDIFFNEGKGNVKIDKNDLNVKAASEGKDFFRIGIELTNYPEELIIDETNPTNLKDEYLLNRNDNLEIWKTFKNAKLQETALKCYHPANDDYLQDILRKKINDLRKFVEENNIDCEDKRKSAVLRKAIRKYYQQKDGELRLDEIEVKVDSEDAKKIWEKLSDYLPLYALFHSDRKNLDQDEEVQDPLKVAIEQIFNEEEVKQNLESIAKKVNEKISKIAQETIDYFKNFSPDSNFNLEPEIPGIDKLKWSSVYKSIGFKTDEIPLNKRGSGIRRIVLLSFFTAEVERLKRDKNLASTIYAIEEPETSLHPDLQKKLIEQLLELSEYPNIQVLITTHSPALIRLLETSSIRYIEQKDHSSNVKNFDVEVADKIIKNMGLLPEIAKVIVCVEGETDEKFLLNINQNIPELKEIIDIESKIEAGILSIIPMRGANLKDWINRYALKNTNAIEFHLYDRDTNEQYKKQIEEVNSRNDGSCGRLTEKREIENYIPKEIVEKEFNIDLSDVENWDYEDIPKKIQNKIPNMKEKDIKMKLCCRCSKEITKKHLEDLNAWDEVKSWFEKINELCSKVLQNP
ncbi:hypothetical protein ciss_01460 [Carboxydothermus islandicus]|uniref:Endonuclease GajA/Old nuclease/RecF-like AAA domain-containing protein n=1 Tax=Carboxydothermus islandicus TaxID=661089 RepID=A0A1L8CZ88_9THEO|nr:ATP-binding protein [Carboxydothermus islandicus]GAV24213.1 hypothetical protein ciss_01460 [Carboxydothermus islandicus]